MVENLKVGDVFWACHLNDDPLKEIVELGVFGSTICTEGGGACAKEDSFTTELEAWRETYRRRQQAANNAYRKAVELDGGVDRAKIHTQQSAAFEHAFQNVSDFKTCPKCSELHNPLYPHVCTVKV